MSEQHDEQTSYRVVLNDEEQYSIWWTSRTLPDGWHAEGTEGTREQCLTRINELWTDLRPLSLRRRMNTTTTAA
ncbi:MbtH family protein [Streptomyces sp. NPDC056347]|uniref:MbtH family protein n=1 Tax=Streptomyces sp. NPDC056347 TaxID=3345790 RepID=UPI0035D9F146